MTILALAFHGFKKLDSFLFPINKFKAIEHLNDHLLSDIGMYREAGQVFNANATPSTAIKTPEKANNKEHAILIPRCLEDSGG